MNQSAVDDWGSPSTEDLGDRPMFFATHPASMDPVHVAHHALQQGPLKPHDHSHLGKGVAMQDITHAYLGCVAMGPWG